MVEIQSYVSREGDQLKSIFVLMCLRFFKMKLLKLN